MSCWRSQCRGGAGLEAGLRDFVLSCGTACAGGAAMAGVRDR